MRLPVAKYLTLALFYSLAAFAQGTFTIRFNELPPGQPLTEQYAAQGIHFFGGVNQPSTVTAPKILGPSGATVGLAENIPGMRFYYSIQGIAMRVAEDGPSYPTMPNLSIFAYDSQGVQ